MTNNPFLKPTVSIVIPCRNERDHIEAALHSIISQEPPAGGFEVIVADGMSDDGTRDVLRRLVKQDSRLRIIDNPQLIIPTGLNAGIRAANGKIIIRMDAHTDYAPDYVRECVAVLNETGAENVGGAWIAEGRGFIGRAIAAAFQSAFSVGGARAHQADYEGALDTVYLGCWRAEIFNRIGLYDEELIRSEDDELNLRITRSGGKIWQSTRIKSRYHPRDSLRSLFEQQLQYGYWKVRVIQKHKLLASIRHVIPACFVLSVILLPPAALISKYAGVIWLAVIGLYLTCNIVAASLCAASTNWKSAAVLPLVFFCYHFGYGCGFLRGVVDFMILRRRPALAYTKLTRISGGDFRKNT